MVRKANIRVLKLDVRKRQTNNTQGCVSVFWSEV